jgi:LacI family transcriptional regulator
MAVSVRDVAERAGVSLGTVSNALNRPDKVAASTLERVRAAIDELGFVRNDVARTLRAGRSNTIGLVVLDAGNPFFTDLARGAQERAAEEGVSVLLGDSGDDPDREGSYLDLFEEQRVRGVLISPIGDVADRLRRLQASGTATVFVDRSGADLPFPSVFVDDVEGGRIAVEHLLSLGRRRIAFVGGPMGLQQVTDRLAGARAAVASVSGASLEVIETSALTVEHGRAVATALLARAAADRPDAVFAANDLLAIGLLQGAVMLGTLRVPEDLALIGYDDIAFASSTVVPLSSVRQPSRELGRTAVELLLSAADGDDEPRRVQFEPQLVARRSTTG